MKLLLDMNLSPLWIDFLSTEKIDVIHWSTIGDLNASDREIMAWAADNSYIVFTHDMDFGTLLAVTQVKCPSVIQIRTQNVLPDAIGEIVVSVLKQFESELEKGALVTVDEGRARVRILPI